MEKKKLGLALCGSYCTYEKLFAALPALAERFELLPIMSDTAAETDTRFGTAQALRQSLCTKCGNEVIHTIRDAEPLGPARPLGRLTF